MKSKEELNALKKGVEALSRKLHELTEEELAQVTGGSVLRPRTVEVDTDSSNRGNGYWDSKLIQPDGGPAAN